MAQVVRVEMDDLFKSAIPILDQLNQAGHDAYFVGGSVRDALLDKPINDIDIASSALPEEVKDIFPKTVDVGIEHGTVMVLYEASSFEVTTFRTEEGYEDFRRPDQVTFVRSLEEDLKRRDFTINAFAMDKSGKIKDYFNGLKDLQIGLIRAVGDPRERFYEDALRMMRALRFQGQLGFDIEDQTLQAITDHAHLLEKISVERIHVELVKLMLGKDRSRALHNFVATQAYIYCPGLEGQEEALLAFSDYELSFETEDQAWTMLAYFLGLEGSQLTSFLKSWKCSNQTVTSVRANLAGLAIRLDSWWTPLQLYQLGEEAVSDVEYLLTGLLADDQREQAIHAYQVLPIHSKKDLALDGGDLMKGLAQPPGQWLGLLLDQLEEAVLNGQVSNRWDDLMAYSKTLVKE